MSQVRMIVAHLNEITLYMPGHFVHPRGTRKRLRALTRCYSVTAHESVT